MAKHVAPAKLTSGAGFKYEDSIAARFLIDMLSGDRRFGPDFGHLLSMDWQTRDTGWLLDDIALTFESENGCRYVGLSIKSARQVTSGGFPRNFVEAAWEQWLHVTSARFQEGRDLIGLVTGKLADNVAEAWETILREAIDVSPERMVERLAVPADNTKGTLASKLQRELFRSIECPEHLQSCGAPSQADTVRLIRHIRLLHFDFQAVPSREQARAIGDCQRLLRSGAAEQAIELWQSLVAISADKRERGGSIDLAGLLSWLRTRFHLRYHADYKADWERLDCMATELLADIRTDIAGIITLPREESVRQVASVLDDRRLCLAIGESGCGKSAVAKIVAQSCYKNVAVVPPELLGPGGPGMLERHLGISNHLMEVLHSATDKCLLLVDAIDRVSESGLRTAGKIIADLHRDESCRHVHVLLTAQFELSSRVIDRLVEAGLDRTELDILPIDSPSEKDIGRAISSVANLSWPTLHRELRPILRNLKVSDWVVRAACAGARLEPTRVTGLTSLIDYLWEHWVEAGGSRFERSAILQRLAILEGETLSSGVLLRQLGHEEQQSLPDLIDADILRRPRNERVRFSHDLLGDWARLRVLIAEGPTSSTSWRDRCATARWHRAVRLYGRWLLEHEGGVGSWRRTMERLDDGSSEGTVVRDLLLEALILTDNSRQVLEQAWHVLASDSGWLLHRLLDRFLFLGTIPDARLVGLARDKEAAAQLEIAARVPYLPYWGPVISTLAAHADDVLVVAPFAAAKVCRAWLEKTPWKTEIGLTFPWRKEASQLAIRIARETQARLAEGAWFSEHPERAAFEASLFAAPELPDEVSQLALELAKRRPLRVDIQERADQAKSEADERARRWEKENPELARDRRRWSLPSFLAERLREAWPDGPSSPVNDGYREACLDGQALVPTMILLPDTALEVLLAVCIREPMHEDPYDSDLRDDLCIEPWENAYPPMYFRGPFLHFLRWSPKHGVDFILRLVNFATQRWAENQILTAKRLWRRQMTMDDLSIGVNLDGREEAWIGDEQVFRWHLDGRIDAKIITCALMALEYWLYEELDQSHNIGQWLKQIVKGSRSVAFAGLLCDVGKKKPAFFTGELKPLLTAWQLFYFDLHTVQQRQVHHPGFIAWQVTHGAIPHFVREWHLAQHRDQLLVAMLTLIARAPEMKTLLAGCRAGWRKQLDDQGNPRELQLLVERFNGDNYREHPEEDGRVRIELVWPEAIEERNREEKSNENLRLLTFPHECRQILDGETALATEALPSFWEQLIRFDQMRSTGNSDPDLPITLDDSILGAIAVLVCRHGQWLRGQPEKWTWCIDRLHGILRSPPSRSACDLPESGGKWNWDCFAAEVAVSLLAENPTGEFAKAMVASSVMAYHLHTTLRTMQLGFDRRKELGALFDKMEDLTLLWSLVRRLRMRSESLQMDIGVWHQQQDRIGADFVRDTLSSVGVLQLRAMALDELQKLERKRLSETWTHAPEPKRRQKRVYTDDPGLDTRVICAGFNWLNLSAANSSAERAHILSRIREFLEMSLGTIPQPEDDFDYEIEGFPSEFDNWVLALAARSVTQMGRIENPSSLWTPILALASPAHRWIERFFWHWFTDAVAVAESPGQFVERWAEMINYAMIRDNWSPEKSRSFDLDDMVFELLGFHLSLNHMATDGRYQNALAQCEAVFAAAAARWFGMPRVLNGFARCVVEEGYRGLICSGIKWIYAAAAQMDKYYFWRERDIEDNLVAALRLCWDQNYDSVAEDQDLKHAFLGLLNMLASHGSHAAMALRDRVLDSIPSRG